MEVAAFQGRQAGGDARMGAAGCVAGAAGQRPGLAREIREAVFAAHVAQTGAGGAVGVGGEDIGAGAQVIAVDLVDQRGRFVQGGDRPFAKGDFPAAIDDFLPHAAVEEGNRGGGHVSSRFLLRFESHFTRVGEAANPCGFRGWRERRLTSCLILPQKWVDSKDEGRTD